MKQINAFCAIEQKDTDHIVTIADNGDYIFTCPCKAFFKMDGSLDKKAIEELIKVEREANSGVVTVEALEAQMAKKLSAFDDAA